MLVATAICWLSDVVTPTKHASIEQHAELVAADPFLRDPAVLESEDRSRLPLDRLVLHVVRPDPGSLW